MNEANELLSKLSSVISQASQDEAERLITAYNGTSEEWKEYLKYYVTLPSSLQAELGYVSAHAFAAKGGFCSANHPAGHFSAANEIKIPFSWNGWFYPPSDWNDGFCSGGFVYEIDPDCFRGRDPLLYYEDEDLPGRTDWFEERVLRLDEVSKGITDLKIQRFPYLKNIEELPVITFRIKPGVTGKLFSQTKLSSKETIPDSKCLICVPRASEFTCSFGEIINGEMIPLAVDSFCMK